MRIHKTLFVLAIILPLFGVLMIWSASHYTAQIYYGDAWYYVLKQLVGLVLGIVGLVGMSFLDYHHLQKWAYIIFGGAVLLLIAVFIPGLGITKLGATRWVGIGSFSLQPSEIAKFALVIFAAKIFTLPVHQSGQIAVPRWWQIGLVLLGGSILCLLVILEPNMSITMTLGIIMLLLLFLCGVPGKVFLWLIIPVAAAVVLMLVAEPYRLARLTAFIDPWANPKDEGFQLIQSLYGIANGGFFGVGFGNSVQKYMFLPFAESDFIFAVIAEEFGMCGCLILFSIFALLIWEIFKVGRHCQDYFGRYLCFGIATVILVQTALNFAVAMGCIPPTGLPLPFISFGGTSLLVFMSAIGIVLNVDKQNKKC